jgi:hypothetical protein
MSLVLAVEPDGEHAKILRRLVGRQPGVQLTVVLSASAAATSMNRRVPDLVLLGSSLDQKSRDHVVDHFILASDAPEPQTLPIPLLCDPPAGSRAKKPRKPLVIVDPDTFATQVAATLAMVDQQRRARGVVVEVEPEIAIDAPAGIDSVVTVTNDDVPASLEDGEIPLDLDSCLPDAVPTVTLDQQIEALQEESNARLASELARVEREAEDKWAEERRRLQGEADARRAEAEAARAQTTAALASVRDAEQALATELARAQADAARQASKLTTESNTARDAAVEQAVADARRVARETLDAELARVKAESEAALAAAVRRAQEEGDARRETEVASMRQSADEMLRAHQQSHVDVQAIRDAAARDARLAADADAARQLEAEIQRLRADAEATREAAVDRVRREAADALEALRLEHVREQAARDAQALEAQAATEKAAALRLEHELALVHAEAEARRDAEIARVTQEFQQALDAERQAYAQGQAQQTARDLDERAAIEQAASLRLDAEIARIQADADARHEAAIARIRREAEETLDAQRRAHADADASRAVAAQQALAASEAAAASDRDVEIARLQAAAEKAHKADIARVRKESERALEAQRHEHRVALAAQEAMALEASRAAETAAAQALEQEIARVRAEASAHLLEEVARLRADAEAQRNEAIAQVVADADARRADEIASLRAEAAARHEAEIARLARESEQALAAQRQAAARESEEALAAQQRAAADADARHAAAMQKARQDAEQVLAAQQRAHADADVQREAREQQARAALEASAAQTMAAELSRVRAEAEQRLQKELGLVRADVEQSREAERRARMDADLARTAAKEARSAADAAAARAHDLEVTRGHVEERLRNEVDGLKHERDRLRMVHQAELEQLRVDTDREVRAHVSAAAQAEIAQLRAELEARLTAEVAAAVADAERRRVSALAAIRAQLDGVDVPAADAPALVSAAPASAPREMALVTPDSPGALSGVSAALSGIARTGGPILKHAFRITMVVLAWTARTIGRLVRASLPIARDFADRHPRAVPAMAVVLMAFAAFTWLDASSFLRSGAPYARSAAGAVASIYGKAKGAVSSGDEKPAATKEEETAVARATAKVPEKAIVAGPGSVTFFSRVPLEIYAGGRRLGSTEDGPIAMPRGRNVVEFVSTRLNYRGEATVDVRSGFVTTHNVFLPAGMLQLETEPGAEVTIEGQRAGVAPLDALPVQLGTREVIVRHPELGERRETIEVRYGEVTHLRMPLRDTDGTSGETTAVIAQ